MLFYPLLAMMKLRPKHGICSDQALSHTDVTPSGNMSTLPLLPHWDLIPLTFGWCSVPPFNSSSVWTFSSFAPSWGGWKCWEAILATPSPAVFEVCSYYCFSLVDFLSYCSRCARRWLQMLSRYPTPSPRCASVPLRRYFLFYFSEKMETIFLKSLT